MLMEWAEKLWGKKTEGVDEWNGWIGDKYPLDCYDVQSTCGAKTEIAINDNYKFSQEIHKINQNLEILTEVFILRLRIHC